jgi:hypothetical protein
MALLTLNELRGNIANTPTLKEEMLVAMAFPSPVEYRGGRGVLGLEGRAWRDVSEVSVQAVILSMSGKKAPGPDGIGASVLCSLWDWDSARLTWLICRAIRLGAHRRSCKVAKGITIPKPGMPSYSTVKSYRVISLLNCLGKVTEVIATMISNHCELGGLHNGQYGCHRGRSAIDAVGMLVANVQQAWTGKQVTGALCMDVEATFPSVTRDCLANKIRKLGIDECLIEWVLDFMTDRSVHMVVDGQEAGLPQGSPASPILLRYIYMTLTSTSKVSSTPSPASPLWMTLPGSPQDDRSPTWHPRSGGSLDFAPNGLLRMRCISSGPRWR